MLLFLITPCLVVAVQPRMEWIPIKYREKLRVSTSARKYRLIKLLIFVFVGRYLPSEIQTIKLFTQFGKFNDFKPVKEKIYVTMILSIIGTEKIWSNGKIRKTVLVSYDFDCLCYNLYFFSDANRFFDGWHMCS